MENYNYTVNQTIENLKSYLAETECRMFEKTAGSSKGAVWERDAYVVNMRLTNLVGHEIDYVIFEAFPGIVTTKVHYPLVSAYIQRLTPRFGAFQADFEHGDIFFKVAVPIRDYPLSVETFRMLEEQFDKEISAHNTALLALANGYLPDNLDELKPVLAYESSPTQSQAFILNADSIREHLEERSNHNIIAEDRDGELPSWKCEIFTGEEHYFMHVKILNEGFATFKMMPGTRGILVQPPYRRMAGFYLDKESAIRKVGHFSIGNETEGVNVSTAVSLREGPVKSECIERIVAILINSLRDVCHDVRPLANGIVPFSKVPDKKPEEDPAERLKRLRQMIHSRRAMIHHEDSDEEDNDTEDEAEDMTDHPLDIDFARLLAQARCLGNEEESEVEEEAE